MNIKKKKQAINLRKEGKSYSEISNLIKVNKSTLSSWFKGIKWSEDIKHNLTEKSKADSRRRLIAINEERKKNLDKYYKKAKKEAIDEFYKLKNNRLFIVALSLYWGEGDRVFNNGIVRISNVDPIMLSVFRDFLEKIVKIDNNKIRAGLLLYSDLDEKKCLKYWSQNIGIGKDYFFKSTIIKGKHKSRKSDYGVCIVSVHDKYLKKKVLTWLDLFKKGF